MEKLRIMSVFGTRPEAIKMAPLVKELASRDEIESLCCVTAQHREMLDSVMEVFDLKADPLDHHEQVSARYGRRH